MTKNFLYDLTVILTVYLPLVITLVVQELARLLYKIVIYTLGFFEGLLLLQEVLHLLKNLF